jgi:Tfp pilus assembly protein PilO
MAKKNNKGLKIDKRNAPYFIMALGLFYGAYLYYGFWSEELPKMDAERTARAAVLSKKQTELKRLREFAQNIEVIKLKLRELNLQLEAALETMPKNYNLSALLRRLAILATNSGVELQSFIPNSQSKRLPGNFYETLDITFNLDRQLFRDTCLPRSDFALEASDEDSRFVFYDISLRPRYPDPKR